MRQIYDYEAGSVDRIQYCFIQPVCGCISTDMVRFAVVMFYGGFNHHVIQLIHFIFRICIGPEPHRYKALSGSLLIHVFCPQFYNFVTPTFHPA